MENTVEVVVTRGGRLCMVYGDRKAADARVAELNADPFLAPGEPDPDAPYDVESWIVNRNPAAHGLVTLVSRSA